MKRWDLVTSDEYISVAIECIVVSKKPIRKIRDELRRELFKYRDELLHGNRGGGCSNKNCKVCYPHKIHLKLSDKNKAQ